MDPNHPIFEQLLEDVVEDESIHSGDVEAFTAELKCAAAGSGSGSDGGSTSAAAPEPLDHGAVAGILPQESNSIVNQSHGQQQDSVNNEVGNKETRQQKRNHLPCNNEQPSIPEGISEGADNKHPHSNIQKECDQPKSKFDQEPGKNPQQSVISQQQPMQQMKNQQTQGTNQTNNATSVGKPPVVTFHMLIPILRRHLDKDKDMQVISIFEKLRKNEVSKDHFLKVIRTIVGDKLLKQAASQYQLQVVQAQRNPQTNSKNYSSLSQVSSQHNVPSGSMAVKQAIDSPRPPQFRPSLPGQMRSNMGYPASESNLQKPNETPNILSASMQAIQHHVQHQQTPLTVSGANNIHARSFPQPVGGSIMSLRPQMADSSQRGQLVQGTVTTMAGSVATQLSSQTNPFTQTTHMNKETLDPCSESAQSCFSALHAIQVNPSLLSSKDGGALENQSSVLNASKSSTATSSSQSHHSHGTQAETDIEIQPTTQTTNVPASKTPQKKASAGQKKPLEAIGSPPPPSSKKQKASGGFHDQSIDQLNDVTAVSGVNLREEEEQLFSAPKEESRVSEAARKVVKVEEERLILQKDSLTMKLAEIMRKCNLKSIGSDVERCLSMCVEERLRGFISNIIRLSKQRVDVEKSRHHFYPLSSDVRSHILRVNREAREQWEKKLAEDAERIRKQNDGDDNAVIDLEKDKNDGRSTSKHAKTYKEEDDKMRTTAANAAVRVAAGGDDMLSKWQLLAERNKQRSEGGDGSSGSLLGNMSPHKTSPKSGKGSREQQENEKRGYFSMLGPGGVRRSPHIKVARSITVKDVIAALEREPQMWKSSLLFRLHGRSPTESAAK